MMDTIPLFYPIEYKKGINSTGQGAICDVQRKTDEC